jgi:hypothetical protein
MSGNFRNPNNMNQQMNNPQMYNNQSMGGGINNPGNFATVRNRIQHVLD